MCSYCSTGIWVGFVKTKGWSSNRRYKRNISYFYLYMHWICWWHPWKTPLSLRGWSQQRALLDFLACIPLARGVSPRSDMTQTFCPLHRDPQKMLRFSGTAASRLWGHVLSPQPPILWKRNGNIVLMVLKHLQDWFTDSHTSDIN